MNKNAITKEEIFEYHLGGKIALGLTKKLVNQKDLSMAYTPGVSKVCEAIKDDESLAYSLTSKGNLVAVITDGTAVLGLGNIGAKASIPVMEGKAVLFKVFAGVDAWPVTIENVANENGYTNATAFIDAVVKISGIYGGINLEDIAAPACFEIEEKLDEILDIPVFHDDQWGTAIITLAALKNYCILSGKKMKEILVVVNGAGAAGIRITEMIKAEGVLNCVVCDSKGIIRDDREDLNRYKRKHAVKTCKQSLKDAMSGADVFIGVSVADCVTEEMVLSMADYPAIFAMANPAPEIKPELVNKCMKGRRFIMATGRSDYPNQVNNVLGFPFIFRGALDVRAHKITMNMKLAAANALADLAREKDIPDEVKKAYGRDFEFGQDYIIPTPFDPRILNWESRHVAETAIKEGVARVKELPDKYR
ncbi:MAG: malate dehydrogenase [Candidatus Omnitrophica bacterium]|nr:malate dehydrogenase [Candidatus Omnitrophota bacterium]